MLKQNIIYIIAMKVKKCNLFFLPYGWFISTLDNLFVNDDIRVMADLTGMISYMRYMRRTGNFKKSLIDKTLIGR